MKTVPVGSVMWSNIVLACRQLQKKGQHNFIGQFYFFSDVPKKTCIAGFISNAN